LQSEGGKDGVEVEIEDELNLLGLDEARADERFTRDSLRSVTALVVRLTPDVRRRIEREPGQANVGKERSVATLQVLLTGTKPGHKCRSRDNDQQRLLRNIPSTSERAAREWCTVQSMYGMVKEKETAQDGISG
jgi:hypothetical protein